MRLLKELISLQLFSAQPRGQKNPSQPVIILLFLFTEILKTNTEVQILKIINIAKETKSTGRIRFTIFTAEEQGYIKHLRRGYYNLTPKGEATASKAARELYEVYDKLNQTLDKLIK